MEGAISPIVQGVFASATSYAWNKAKYCPAYESLAATLSTASWSHWQTHLEQSVISPLLYPNEIVTYSIILGRNAFKIVSQWGTQVPSRDRGQLVPGIQVSRDQRNLHRVSLMCLFVSQTHFCFLTLYYGEMVEIERIDTMFVLGSLHTAVYRLHPAGRLASVISAVFACTDPVHCSH